jgi:hypothetical protein
MSAACEEEGENGHQRAGEQTGRPSPPLTLSVTVLASRPAGIVRLKGGKREREDVEGRGRVREVEGRACLVVDLGGEVEDVLGQVVADQRARPSLHAWMCGVGGRVGAGGGRGLTGQERLRRGDPLPGSPAKRVCYQCVCYQCVSPEQMAPPQPLSLSSTRVTSQACVCACLRVRVLVCERRRTSPALPHIACFHACSPPSFFPLHPPPLPPSPPFPTCSSILAASALPARTASIRGEFPLASRQLTSAPPRVSSHRSAEHVDGSAATSAATHSSRCAGPPAAHGPGDISRPPVSL